MLTPPPALRAHAVLLLCFLPLLVGVAAAQDAAPEAETYQPTSPKWEADITRFEKQTRAANPEPGGNLFLGSSSIRLWDLPQFFPAHRTFNRGFGGSQIEDSLVYFERIVPALAPSVVVLYAGDNDIAKGKSPETVHRHFKAFADKLHERFPKTKLVFIAIKPSVARWKLAPNIQRANDMIAATCKQSEHLVFADIWTPMLGEDGTPMPDLLIEDGLHMSAKGYALWTKIITPHLMATPKAKVE